MLDSRGRVRSPVRVPPASSRTARRHWLCLLLPVAVMAALGFWGLGRDGAMGNDEVATRWISGLSLHAMAHVLNRLDAVHGLYYLVIHFWSVLGDGPTAMRVPSVLAMVAAVAVVGLIGLRLTGSALIGTTAGLIAALTPSITFYAQTARSYALVYLAVALATLVLTTAVDADAAGSSSGSSARRWSGYCALMILAGYLNELSLLVLAAHLVTLCVARTGKRSLFRWLAAAVVAVLAVSPLVVISRRESDVLDYLRRPGLGDLEVLFHTFFGATLGVAVVVALLAVVGLVSTVVARRPGGAVDAMARPVSLAAVALPLIVVPAGLLIAYSEIFRPLYVDRYVLFGEMGVALSAAAGIERAVRVVARAGRPAVLSWGLALVVCACGLVFQLGPQHDERQAESRQFDFGGPAEVVQAGARPGDGVLFFDSFYRKTRLGYPAAFAKTDDFAMAASPARFGTFRGRNKPFAAIAPLMLERRRIWVIGRSPGNVEHSAPSIRRQAALLRRDFTVLSRHRFGRIDVTLWQRD